MVDIHTQKKERNSHRFNVFGIRVSRKEEEGEELEGKVEQIWVDSILRKAQEKKKWQRNIKHTKQKKEKEKHKPTLW